MDYPSTNGKPSITNPKQSVAHVQNTPAIIALGANLSSPYGEPWETITWAIIQIAALENVTLTKRAPIIKTEPVGIAAESPILQDNNVQGAQSQGKSCDNVSQTASSQSEDSISVPQFYNTAIEVQTLLEPLELLHQLQTIENLAGRIRHQNPNIKLSRTLDLDIITYGDLTLEAPELTIPHPRAKERDFVMEPIAMLEPC